MSQTKHFTSENKWFSLDYPAHWQVDFEDSVYTFTEAGNSNWALQISAYQLDNTLDDFDIRTALEHEKLSNPSAVMVSLKNQKAIYYTEKDHSFLVRYWILGGKRCKALCTFTTNSNEKDGNLNQVETSINSIKIQ